MSTETTVNDRIESDPDREVWVVEWTDSSEGNHWKTGAVLGSFQAADKYREDLREYLNQHNDEIPERFRNESNVRIRSGSRKSPTKMYETWPPDGGDE